MIQGVGENPEGTWGRRNLGPLLDNLWWNPYEACNLKKNRTFRDQFLLLPYSSYSGHIWRLFQVQKPEKQGNNFCNYELNLKAVYEQLMYLLWALCIFWTQNCTNRKMEVPLKFLTSKPEVDLGGENCRETKILKPSCLLAATGILIPTFTDLNWRFRTCRTTNFFPR